MCCGLYFSHFLQHGDSPCPPKTQKWLLLWGDFFCHLIQLVGSLRLCFFFFLRTYHLSPLKHHLGRQLCQKHWGTRFVKINAEKAPYLVESLGKKNRTGNRLLRNNRRVAGYRTKIIYDHLYDYTCSIRCVEDAFGCRICNKQHVYEYIHIYTHAHKRAGWEL